MVKFPKRVSRRIQRFQQRSEYFVGIGQLLVLALVTLTYHVTPATHSMGAPLQSIPLGVSLYAILVLTRLYFAYTHQLNDYVLGGTTILEMGIVIFTIWSYHIQLEAPEIIVLKSHLFYYVFVVLAIRALRFEPLWIILSGATAAIGWAFVLSSALMHAPPHHITWDYITFVYTPMAHPISEFSKIASVLMVTAILSYAVNRARFYLHIAIEKGQAAEDFSKFFDANVANKITNAELNPEAGISEERSAAILFIDLRGFTNASHRLSPSELIAMLSEYQQRVIPIVTAHNGSVDKFMGDGILVSFGATSPSTNYAADALLCTHAILEDADNWEHETTHLRKLAIGVGGAAGRIVFGMIGYQNRLEYTVIGETVNKAAKLEKLNKDFGSRAAISQTLYEAASAQDESWTDQPWSLASISYDGFEQVEDVALMR